MSAESHSTSLNSIVQNPSDSSVPAAAEGSGLGPRRVDLSVYRIGMRSPDPMNPAMFIFTGPILRSSVLRSQKGAKKEVV